MSVKKYVIKKNQGNFTSFPNSVLQNINDYGAVGLYTYLSSLPPGWEFYKKHLQEHGRVGRNQLEKLLKILVQHNLVHCVQARNEKGHFAHFEMEVNDGDAFVYVASEPVANECVQPLAENGLTVNGLPVNDDYKGYKEKEYINTKDISKNNSAIDIARKQNDDAFDEFWRGYPIKKNKVRSKKIWDREKFASIVTLICCDVLTRIKHEPQWQQKQFIPHPATYLGNKLWTDEVTESSEPKKSSGKSSSFDAYQADLQKQNRGTTYEHGAISQ